MDEKLKPEDVALAFKGSFTKLTTLVDGGIRISFDVSLSEIKEVVRLPSLTGRPLAIAIIPEPRKSRLNRDES